MLSRIKRLFMKDGELRRHYLSQHRLRVEHVSENGNEFVIVDMPLDQALFLNQALVSRQSDHQMLLNRISKIEIE